MRRKALQDGSFPRHEQRQLAPEPSAGVAGFDPLPLFPLRGGSGYTLRAPNRTLGPKAERVTPIATGNDRAPQSLAA